jgi:hypothetical protein
MVQSVVQGELPPAPARRSERGHAFRVPHARSAPVEAAETATSGGHPALAQIRQDAPAEPTADAQ